MISKRAFIKPENDNYSRLADYIAAADHEGEKLLYRWCAGCLGGEDYAEGIAEILDTQAMNTRTSKSKTYHLIVSFRPEDEARLTPEVLRAMEEHFAAALDLSEHQRHCGIHKNTGNLHLHVAYNLIHPERLTMREPFRDFRKRDRLCRELEKEYGLHIDNGREQRRDALPLGEKAAALEAHSGQESFESYARRQPLVEALEHAGNWQELHQAFAIFGMEIKPHGNGLVAKDRHGKQAVKASAVDRSLSLKKLEARFGLYQPPAGLDQVQEQRRYQAEPLHRSPERGNLYAEYRRGIDERKARLQAVKEREDAALAAIRAQWAAKRREIERMGLAKKNRRNLLTLARKHEAEAIALATAQPEREAVRRDIPFTSWNGFLQHKAEQGNETALAILRSQKEAVAEEQEPVQEKDWSQHGREQFTGNAARKADFAARERAALETDGISGKGKNHLLAVLRMERLAAEEKRTGQQAGIITGFRHKVDHKGVVVFTLPGGGVIRDQGKELFFSARDEAARAVAKLYARMKWGKNLHIEGNKIARLERGLEKEQIREQRQHIGL